MLQFYTVWGLIIHIMVAAGLSCHNFGIVVALQIFFGGNYITFVNPKYVKFKKWKIEGELLHVFNLLTHIAPLYMYVASTLSFNVQCDNWNSAWILYGVYSMCVNITDTYNIDDDECGGLVVPIALCILICCMCINTKQ
jgi:hypothetical protein